MSTDNLAEQAETNHGLMESTFALIDKLEKAETGIHIFGKKFYKHVSF
jgi:hypothetical protein